MKIYCKTNLYGFIPADEDEYENFQKVGTWEGYVDVKKQRNSDFHRKFFKMVKTVYENQELYNNSEHLRKILTMKAGYVDTVVTNTGVTYLPHSIAFDKMDETEFKEFYSKFVDAVIKEFKYNDDEYKNILMDFIK